MKIVDFSQIINQLKAAGIKNIRIIPMEGQSVLDGNQRIEILKDGQWVAVVSNISKKIAEDMVKQAGNRVILG